MKFDLSYPLDVLAEVATSLYWRLLAFAASIFFGVWLGASIAAGALQPLGSPSGTFVLFGISFVAALVSPLFLAVDMITLLILVALIYSESAKSLWISIAVLTAAWAWLAYSCANFVGHSS